jgi:hypothetical protein
MWIVHSSNQHGLVILTHILGEVTRVVGWSAQVKAIENSKNAWHTVVLEG